MRFAVLNPHIVKSLRGGFLQPRGTGDRVAWPPAPKTGPDAQTLELPEAPDTHAPFFSWYANQTETNMYLPWEVRCCCCCFFSKGRNRKDVLVFAMGNHFVLQKGAKHRWSLEGLSFTWAPSHVCWATHFSPRGFQAADLCFPSLGLQASFGWPWFWCLCLPSP